jgi:hypothetical protein
MGGGRVWPRLTSVALSLQLGLSCAPRRAVRLHPRPQASRRLRLHPRRRHGPGGCGGASTSGKGTCAVSGFRGGSQPGSGFVVAATSALPPPPYRHRSSIGAGQDAAVHHAAVHGAEAGHEEGRAHRPPRHRRLPDVARRQLGEGWVEVRCRPYAPAPCYSVRASRGCLMQLARVLNGRRITSPPPFRVCLFFRRAAEIQKWVGDRIKPLPIAEATRDQAIMQINTFLNVRLRWPGRRRVQQLRKSLALPPHRHRPVYR